MSSKNQVAKLPEEEAQLPAVTDDLDIFADAGAGTEEITGQDVMIPFLRLLQDLSAQVKKTKPEYVEGAEPGMFINTASNQLYSGDEGIIVIPCMYQVHYTEWKPRKEGGGLVANYGTDSSILEVCETDDRGKHIVGDKAGDASRKGNEVVRAGTFFVIIVDQEKEIYTHAVISLASTAWKVSRKWNTLIKEVLVKKEVNGQIRSGKPAMFFRSYRIRSVPESNDAGDWFQWKIEYHKPLVATLNMPEALENGTMLYKMAKDFYESVSRNEVKVAEPVENEERQDAATGDLPF